MRNLFLMNILLTFIWVALTGKFSYGNFVFGYALSYLILWVLSRGSDQKSYFRRVPGVLGFLVFFIKELVKANIYVAYDVITTRHHMNPGIVAIPLEAKTDLEITIVSNFITLTPGTFSVDVSSDKKTLYLHAMYIGDKEAFVQDIKNGFERRILEIMR